MSDTVRVAVIGGGCASMAAAFELTNPALHGRYDVTIYQMGWRLGGKGASGRGPSGRIEEHGLHLWMGYYENAFRLMRECYSELNRDPRSIPIARFADAFIPANLNAAADLSPDGRWLPWVVRFPETPGLPGDPGPLRWTVPEYLARAAALLRTLLSTLRTHDGPMQDEEAEIFGRHMDGRPGHVTAETLSATLPRILRYGTIAGLGVTIEGLRMLEAALRVAPAFPQSLLANFVDAIASALTKQLADLMTRDDSARRLWEVADLILAAIRGSIRFRLAIDPRGFDAIDDYDSREWLQLNGASPTAINSTFIRALYDLAFAYDGGDPMRPRIAAGSAMRGAFRAFFGYRGAFFWKMSAGMGDVVFAPLYEVLRRRGVRFEFFHKLTNVHLSGSEDEEPHVESLEFDVQSRVRGDGDREYAPLVLVNGQPCWPSRPDYDQLVDGERMRDEQWDLESQWDSRHTETRTLRVSEHFDMVVLGVGLGVVPYVCRELIDRNARWRDMLERVRSVPTQAFQLWMNRDTHALGWEHGFTNVSGFVEPFDTWADMSHLARYEAWSAPPRSIAYFCNVLRDVEAPSANDIRTCHARRYIDERYAAVRENAVRFLRQDVRHLWPRAVSSDGDFRWSLVLTEDESRTPDESLFNTQFWTANVRPSDRYTQALPGSSRFRISPLDRTYDNFAIAGDWTNCGLNMGCVEAAVMSGLLAAHAISQSPKLSEIVGYNHP